MDSFYTIVVCVALALLVLFLIVMGIMLQKQDDDKPFPAYETECPDGWEVNNGTCVVPATTHPNYPKNNVMDTYSGADKLYTSDFDPIAVGAGLTFNTGASKCDKQKWTSATQVTWDGISNYNKC